jgi:hypothetical protein
VQLIQLGARVGERSWRDQDSSHADTTSPCAATLVGFRQRATVVRRQGESETKTSDFAGMAAAQRLAGRDLRRLEANSRPEASRTASSRPCQLSKSWCPRFESGSRHRTKCGRSPKRRRTPGGPAGRRARRIRAHLRLHPRVPDRHRDPPTRAGCALRHAAGSGARRRSVAVSRMLSCLQCNQPEAFRPWATARAFPLGAVQALAPDGARSPPPAGDPAKRRTLARAGASIPMDVAPIHSSFGSSSSSPENSGVMRRECGYTR